MQCTIGAITICVMLLGTCCIHTLQTLLPCFSLLVQEIIILTLSTMWWEEDPLSTVNITGMVICVAGITTHTTMKAWDSYSKFLELAGRYLLWLASGIQVDQSQH